MRGVGHGLRVVLVDPRRNVRALVPELQRRRVEVRGVASEARIFRALIAHGDIDAVVVAGSPRRVPQVMAEVREASARVPVVVCGDSPARDELLDALRAGAGGFIVADGQVRVADELAGALEWVASGGVYVSPRVAGHLVREVRESTAGRGFDALTETGEVTRRERQVLELMASGLTYREVGERLSISGTTVKTHVQSALRKLGLRNRIEAVQWIMTHGRERAAA